MALRHRLEPDRWQSVFRRLEELVLGNSGEDDFQEVFKLLVAKLYQETHEPGLAFAGTGPADTRARIGELLERADVRWPGILPDGTDSRLTADHLQVCAEALEPLVLHDAGLEVLDALFEHLVERSAKGAKGQFFTPRHVIDAIVRMAAPSRHEQIADPACGSSGFLVHAAEAATRELPAAAVRAYCRENVWGFDIDVRALQVARALTAITSDGSANLHRLNSLLTAPPDSDAAASADTIEDVMRAAAPDWRGFDVITTNPPFAGEVREPALLDGYALARDGRRTERDTLFIERCVHLLAPGGRLAIVLPSNKTGGARFAHGREWLIRQTRVVAVLSLGRDTFLPHTSQKAEVVFALKRREPVELADAAGERILMLTSERAGKDSKGNPVFGNNADPATPAWKQLDHDLDAAVEAFWEFVDDEALAWGRG